ncbi:MAG: sensor histidine kinase [Acidimicrobiia bacterium]
METSQLIEIALASFDASRIEINGIEAADVAMEAVGGLTQLVTELADNAIAFSGPGEKVSVTAVFDGDDYLISISDNGVGIPESMISAINAVLGDRAAAIDDSRPSLGIAMVARLAARHGFGVRLIPAVPGTTARVTVPSRLVSRRGAGARPESSPAPEPGRAEQLSPGHVVAMTDSARREAEAFLDGVFGPMRGESASRRPAGRAVSNGNGHSLSSPVAPPLASPDADGLETRVPGENFPVEEDDPSTTSGEAAIDIRLSLSRFEEGRQAAADSDVDDIPF